jgi:hypothetical protein
MYAIRSNHRVFPVSSLSTFTKPTTNTPTPISLTPAITLKLQSHASYRLHNLIAGSPRSPQNLSSRVVFLFLLLLSLFLTTSYSAIIVSLLQTPSDAVNTLTELINSPFHLSMEDLTYNTKLVNVRGENVMTTVRTAHGHWLCLTELHMATGCVPQNCTWPLVVSHRTAHGHWLCLTELHMATGCGSQNCTRPTGCVSQNCTWPLVVSHRTAHGHWLFLTELHTAN